MFLKRSLIIAVIAVHVSLRILTKTIIGIVVKSGCQLRRSFKQQT